MATSPQEMEDLSKISGSLLVNFGTISDIDGMLEAGEDCFLHESAASQESKLNPFIPGKWVNAYKNPVIFDPVAVGATKHRFNAAQSRVFFGLLEPSSR